jgi:SAM-dependent methyltransferase
VPRAEFRERRAELPARDVPLLVVADTAADAAEAAADLAARGFRRVDWLGAPLADLPGGLSSREPAARLWRPAPLLEEALPAIPPGRALDIAAGSGRDSVYLALHGFEVEAWDHAPEALERARALATRHSVAIRTVTCDLEADGFAFPAARYDLVVCFRFLHRPLFRAIHDALAPGGQLLYETFRAGQERFGRPLKPRHLLAEGELAAAFPGLDTVRYAESEPAGGPVTARLWARKPSSRDG